MVGIGCRGDGRDFEEVVEKVFFMGREAFFFELWVLMCIQDLLEMYFINKSTLTFDMIHQNSFALGLNQIRFPCTQHLPILGCLIMPSYVYISRRAPLLHLHIPSLLECHPFAYNTIHQCL